MMRLPASSSLRLKAVQYRWLSSKGEVSDPSTSTPTSASSSSSPIPPEAQTDFVDDYGLTRHHDFKIPTDPIADRQKFLDLRQSKLQAAQKLTASISGMTSPSATVLKIADPKYSSLPSPPVWNRKLTDEERVVKRTKPPLDDPQKRKYPFSTNVEIPPYPTAIIPRASLLKSQIQLLRYQGTNARFYPLFESKSLSRIKPGSLLYMQMCNNPQTREDAGSFVGVLLGIKRSGGEITIRVRNEYSGVAVEQVFNIGSPFIKDIKVLRKPVRMKRHTSKLYYLRDKPETLKKLAQIPFGNLAKAVAASDSARRDIILANRLKRQQAVEVPQKS